MIDAAPAGFGSRNGIMSLPHIPEALIAITASFGPGEGSGNSSSATTRSPLNTTPRIGRSGYQETAARLLDSDP